MALPTPTLLSERRHQISLSAVSYYDALSLQAMGLIDLGPVEIKLQLSQRLFPGLTDASWQLKPFIANDRQILGVEVGRYFVNRHRQYGRLSVEGVIPLNGKIRFLKIGMAGGVLEGADSRWAHSLNVAFLLAFPSTFSALVAQLETRYRLADAAGAPALGGFLSWTYRFRETTAPGDYEMMLFSFGPSLSWRGFRLALSVRVELDKRIDAARNGSNPSGVRVPDVALAWATRL